MSPLHCVLNWEVFCIEELFYCGGKYRRSTGKEIVKVAVNWPTGQKKKPKSNEPCRCVCACAVPALLRWLCIGPRLQTFRSTHDKCNIVSVTTCGRIVCILNCLLIYGSDRQDIFSDVPKVTNLVQQKIVLRTSEPIRSKPYRLPYHLTEAVDKEIDELLKLGFIEPSNGTGYASRIVVVQKIGGTVLVDWCSQSHTHCCTVICCELYIRLHYRLVVCTLLNASDTMSCTVSTIRAILVPFHGILCCYDIRMSTQHCISHHQVYTSRISSRLDPPAPQMQPSSHCVTPSSKCYLLNHLSACSR